LKDLGGDTAKFRVVQRHAHKVRWGDRN